MNLATFSEKRRRGIKTFCAPTPKLRGTQYDGRFMLYEGPCGHLESVHDGWADAVITSPPFNLGHGPDDFSDQLPQASYEAVLRNMVQGAARVIAPSGLLIVDAAKWVGHNGESKFELAHFIDDVANQVGLRPVVRLCYTSVEDEPMDGRGHSATELVTAYGHCSVRPQSVNSKIQALYRFGEGQPEDVWPPSLVRDLVSTFGLAGKKIVDPFAGGGALLLEVLRNGGSVVGFEISVSRVQSILDQVECPESAVLA